MKREAARRALDLVEPDMRLGLGTGTTARHFVDLLGERVASGLKVRCVATSEATLNQANSLGIPMTTLDEMPELDLTVDGADEIDPELRLIKGGGGALLREKIVAAASRRMAVIADASKLVPRLGAFPLPVEVVPFGLTATRRHIEMTVEKSWPFRRDRFARRRLAFRDRRRPLHPRLRPRRHYPNRNDWPQRFRRSPASSSMACSSATPASRLSPRPRLSKRTASSDLTKDHPHVC